VVLRQDALAGPLHGELARVAAGAAADAPAPALLPELLRVYAAAVGAHAACAGLHPDVAPLLGQAPAEQAPAGDYFAAAGAAPELDPPAPARGAAGRAPAGKRGRPAASAPARAPGLTEVLAAARRGSAAAAGSAAGVDLLLPAAVCAVQRMAVLHERVLRARCACSPRAADAGAEGAAGRSAPCRRGSRT
jgi:hypothetical protein